MIEQGNTDDDGPLSYTMREDCIFSAWRRIAAWMVVNQHECAGCCAQSRAKCFAWACAHRVKAASRDASACAKSTSTIECEQPEFFVLERRETRGRPLRDIFRLRESGRRAHGFARGPATEL